MNNRQTVFFLLVDPKVQKKKDLDTIDLNAPRHAQYVHKAWNRHQNAVYWVDINLALKKGLMGQSIVLSEIKAEVPLENDIPSRQNLLLQRYEERIKLLSQENKVSKFCMDTGFILVVEIGQYFMTKDTGEQFFARACREYTFPRSDESSQPKGWIQGNTRIGPVLEITTSYLYSKHGIEVRIWSLRKDNSQSWVRISHGSNKFVIYSNEQQQHRSS